jgi:hypothetical protein
VPLSTKGMSKGGLGLKFCAEVMLRVNKKPMKGKIFCIKQMYKWYL